MERAQLSVGQRLEQERLIRGWTQEYVAERIGVEPATVGRWERGLHKPQPVYHQTLCALFGKTKQELGLGEEDENERPIRGQTGGQTRMIVPVMAPIRDASTAFRAQDLTTRLEALVWSWLLRKNANARYRELQVTIILELERKDNTSMNDEVLSRRDALRRLASTTIEYCGLSLLGPVFLRPIEEILAQCAAGITACWYLRKGKDLAFAFDTVSWYIPTLQEIAATGSAMQRKEAADLLAQCLILQSTLAWHVSGISNGTSEAQQANKYAEAAGNQLLQIIALRTQSVAYRFSNQWDLALEAAEQAKHLLQTTKIPIAPRMESYVYGGLAMYQAYKGQKQDALHSLKIAHETFYSQSADAPIPLQVEMYHEEANLVLNDGLTHLYLGLYREASDSFAQVASLSEKSEINRTEALINQALAEASREDSEPDMKQCITLWTQGIEGAKVLGSQQRFNEAIVTYATMCGTWKKEKAIKDLRGLVVWPGKKGKDD